MVGSTVANREKKATPSIMLEFRRKREIAVKLMRSSRLERWKGEIVVCILGALGNESVMEREPSVCRGICTGNL